MRYSNVLENIGIAIRLYIKIIVITGASRGIGLAAAKKFLENGWQIIGTYSRTVIPIDSKKR